jgi:hypothetical protein
MELLFFTLKLHFFTLELLFFTRDLLFFTLEYILYFYAAEKCQDKHNLDMVYTNEERSAAVSNVLRQVGRARKGGKFKI